MYHTQRNYKVIYLANEKSFRNNGVTVRIFQQKFWKRKKKGMYIDCKIQVIWHAVASTNLSDKTNKFSVKNNKVDRK